MLAAVEGDGMAVAEVDLPHARVKRYTDLADPLADRRPVLYGAVAVMPSPQPASGDRGSFPR